MSFKGGLKVGGGWVWCPLEGASVCRSTAAQAIPHPCTFLPSATPINKQAQVVKVRAESMAAAAKLGKPHGMLSGEWFFPGPGPCRGGVGWGGVGETGAGELPAAPVLQTNVCCSAARALCRCNINLYLPYLFSLTPCAVVGLSDADLESICAAVRGSMPGAVCQLANFLFPQGRVVSGAWGGGATAVEQAQLA